MFERFKDPNLKRRNSIQDFTFKKKRDPIIIDLKGKVSMVAYGQDLAAAQLSNQQHQCKRSEGHETHFVDGERLLGRGWGRKPSGISMPSMFDKANNFVLYNIDNEENRYSKLEWRA